MIKKITKIFNVGRFEKYEACGDTEFKKMSVLFGENGRGKTTLSAIFRSLKKNEPIYILERSTLGQTNCPEVEFRIDDKNYSFKENGWIPGGYKNIEIFDSTFINENVFSGENVEHDHKKNLYRFVVGEKGVGLAQNVNDLDSSIREKGNEITSKSAEMQRYIIGRKISIEDFLMLSQFSDIDNEILKKKREIEVIEKSATITSKPLFQKLILPNYPQDDAVIILNKQLSNVLRDAEEKTKEHIKDNLDSYGESWIQKGLAYIKNDNCPFCGQNCDAIDLIEAYKGYFDKEYNKLKEDISLEIKKIQNLFSESALIYVQKNHNSNEALADFWSQYVLVEIPELPFIEIQEVWKNLRDLSVEHFRQKNLSPLEIINVGDDFKIAFEKFNEINKKIEKYNVAVEKINEAIQKKKLAAGGGNLKDETEELEKLFNYKVRYEKDAMKLCTEYNQLASEKREMEVKKKESKNNLDLFAKDVFEKYQKSINEYLEKFGAGFEIIETQTSFIGGKPSSNYCIKINDVSVGLGDTKTYGEPCFRNVLSQGDKNSLAFAFFLARLDQDDEIGKKIVVFDDPISSLDGFRRNCTEDQILKVSKKAEQCLVASHDKYFLRSLYDNSGNDSKALSILRVKKEGSKIQEWDINSDTMGGYFDDFYRLLKFLDGAEDSFDFRSIARCLRPVIEGYLRMKYPKDFLPQEWLGDFVRKANAAKQGDLLFSFPKNNLEELEEINKYSKKYHHKDNPSADAEEITDTELKTFVKRTINLISS